MAQHEVLVSADLLAELADVVRRPKFDPYLAQARRMDFVARIAAVATPVRIAHRVQVCRDPADDVVLDVAVNGAADAILTGDADLLVLHPFRGIAILAPSAWLGRQV